MIAVKTVQDLTGLTGPEAEELLEDAGFFFRKETAGGYLRYIHADGSQMWIRPDGEVIRLGPKVKGKSGKKYHPRFNQYGNTTKLHSTGEKLIP